MSGRQPGTGAAARPGAAARSDTAARITAATFALLAENGLAGITMSAIAARAGVSRQTLYNHFPDVDSILAAGLAQHHDDDLRTLAAMLATIPSASGRLEHLVRHATVAASQHGTMPDLHQGLSPSAQQAARDYDEAVHALIRDALVLGQESGEFPAAADPDLQSVLVRHVLNGAAELAAARPDDLARIADMAIELARAATQTGG